MSTFEIGDAVYCLVADTTVLALGVVAPSSPIDAATLDGYDSSAFWRKAENVTAYSATYAGNSDLLDGIDSLSFLRRKLAGSDEVWYARSQPGIGSNSTSVHPHGLGRTPTCVLVTRASTQPVAGAVCSVVAVDASSVSLYWPGHSTGTADVYLLVIG